MIFWYYAIGLIPTLLYAIKFKLLEEVNNDAEILGTIIGFLIAWTLWPLCLIKILNN